jgi:hypothetical protein
VHATTLVAGSANNGRSSVPAVLALPNYSVSVHASCPITGASDTLASADPAVFVLP